MTYKFSNKSEQILNTVRLELNILAHKVLEISPIDFTIVEGYRDIERQKQLYKEGKTKTLNSKHCTKEAIDIVPYINNKLDYEAVNDCCFIIGLFYAKAKELSMSIKVGALWNNNSIKNNSFLDVWHVEIY